MDEAIYRRPRDYDLEHDDDGEDVAFYVELAKRLRPRRVLELGAGSGRVTTPLAELGAGAGFTVTALDASPEMLAEARRKLAAAEPRVRKRVELVTGDMRTWEAPALPAHRLRGRGDLRRLPFSHAAPVAPRARPRRPEASRARLIEASASTASAHT
jgi:SAM-dependent methyltransferase